MRLRLFLFFTIVPFLAFAQPGWLDGYVITNTRDTLYGKIYYAPPGQRSAKITFKEDGKNEKVKYRPFTIKGYFVNKQYFASRIYDVDASSSFGLAVFMRWVNYEKKGPVKIFEYWNTDQQFGFTQTFLAKSEGTSFEIDMMRFKKTTAIFFRDYPELQNDILEGHYGRKQLEEIVDRYNAWRKFDKWNKKYSD